MNKERMGGTKTIRCHKIYEFPKRWNGRWCQVQLEGPKIVTTMTATITRKRRRKRKKKRNETIYEMLVLGQALYQTVPTRLHANS